MVARGKFWTVRTIGTEGACAEDWVIFTVSSISAYKVVGKSAAIPAYKVVGRKFIT